MNALRSWTCIFFFTTRYLFSIANSIKPQHKCSSPTSAEVFQGVSRNDDLLNGHASELMQLRPLGIACARSPGNQSCKEELTEAVGSAQRM